MMGGSVDADGGAVDSSAELKMMTVLLSDEYVG